MSTTYIAKRNLEYCVPNDSKEIFSDFIDLSVGDVSRATYLPVTNAAFRDVVEKGYTRYGHPMGDPELRSAICRVYKEDYDIDVKFDEVLITASSCMGMYLSLVTVLNPGDEVLLIAPYFMVYRGQVRLAGGEPVEVPTFAEDGFRIREDELRKKITPKTRAIIINNPCNPTGAFYTREVLEGVARVAEEFDLIVLADEIYTYYLQHDKYVSFISLPGMKKRTLILNSFSKNFLMTGWRVGNVIGDPDILNTMCEINGHMAFTTSSVSQRAAISALANRKAIMEDCVKEYLENARFATEEIKRKVPYLDVMEPQGTYYIFPSIKRTGLTSEQFRNKLYNEAHINVHPGNMFGECGEGYFRMVCSTKREIITEAIRRMSLLKF